MKKTLLFLTLWTLFITVPFLFNIGYNNYQTVQPKYSSCEGDIDYELLEAEYGFYLDTLNDKPNFIDYLLAPIYAEKYS